MKIRRAYWKWQARRAYRKQERLLKQMEHINGGWEMAKVMCPAKVMAFDKAKERMNHCIDHMKAIDNGLVMIGKSGKGNSYAMKDAHKAKFKPLNTEE